MKNLLAKTLIILSLFSLTACFGSEDEEAIVDDTSPSYSKYEQADFGIIYPKDWEVITKDNFTSNIPASTVIVFRNNIKSDLFTANLNISQSVLNPQSTSLDFSIQTLNTEKYNLVGFQEISRETYTIGGEESFIVTFQGRKTITENLIEFKQLCIARNGYGIIITAAYTPNENQSIVMKMDEMVRSFTLKSS
jgi:hypothetical protein